MEQVGAHLRRAQLDEQCVVEVLASVFVLGEIGLGQRLAGPDVRGARVKDFLPGEYRAVDAGLALDDFAGSQVAVFLRLDQCVFVDRFAEVLAVVGCDLLVFL